MPRIVQFFEFGLPRTRSRSILVFLPSVLSPDKFQKGSLLGPTAMHSYRAYLLDAYEHIIDSIDLTCGEDESTRARPESLWADTQWSSGTTRARSRRLSHIGTTFVARTTNPGISRHLCSLDGLCRLLASGWISRRGEVSVHGSCWGREFDESIALPEKRKLIVPRDAASYITAPPKKEPLPSDVAGRDRNPDFGNRFAGRRRQARDSEGRPHKIRSHGEPSTEAVLPFVRIAVSLPIKAALCFSSLLPIWFAPRLLCPL